MTDRMTDRRDVRRVLDHDRYRKKREEDAVSIRKQKREDLNLKRRMLAPSGESVSLPPAGGVVEPAPGPVLAKMPVDGYEKFTNLTDDIAAFQSQNPMEHLQAAHHIRRLLSLEKNPPIDAVIAAGCLPYLVACLGAEGNQKLQFEAAWALTNVASGESRHTNKLVECGAVRPLLLLLRSPSWEIREQAVWALGNIAGDGAGLRDQLLQWGAMQELINMMHQLLRESVPPTLVRNTAWTLSNMYRGKPSPPLDLVAPGLPLLKDLLSHPDDEVVIDTIWAVSYATECNVIDKPTPSSDMPTVDQRIDAVCAAGILPEVFRYLTAPELAKALPAVRTFGNILTGSSKYTDLVLSMNVLPPFLLVLKRKNRVIRKEVLWAMSNVAAGTPEHVQALMNAGVIAYANSIINKSEFDLQKEAGWLVSNAAVCATPEQVMEMVNNHLLLESLVATLDLPEVSLLKMTLSSLDNVLSVGSQLDDVNNPYVERLKELGIEDVLEKLQSHKNHKVFDAAYQLAGDYFQEEGDTMDEGSLDDGETAPTGPTSLNFGPPSTTGTTPQFSFGNLTFSQPAQGGQNNFFQM